MTDEEWIETDAKSVLLRGRGLLPPEPDDEPEDDDEPDEPKPMSFQTAPLTSPGGWVCPIHAQWVRKVSEHTGRPFIGCPRCHSFSRLDEPETWWGSSIGYPPPEPPDLFPDGWPGPPESWPNRPAPVRRADDDDLPF